MSFSGPFIPPVAVPPTRTPVSPTLPPGSTGDLNQVQVQALGGPRMPPQVPRQAPRHSGAADNQAYIDSLNRRQHKNASGYTGFHAPVKPPVLGQNTGVVPPGTLPR